MKPIEVCSCSVAFNAYKEALAKANAASSKNSDEQIKLLAEYAESLAATGCVDLETQTDPQSLYPSLAKFVASKGKNMTMTQVYGRICRDPAILVSDEARFEKAVTPWEFSNIQSDAAACRCPLDTEYFSENFVESDPAVAVRRPSDRGEYSGRGAKQDDTADVGNAGARHLQREPKRAHGWAGTDVTGLTVSGSGNATLKVNSNETEVPLYPGSKNKASCGGMLEPDVRINFCLYDLEDTATPLPIAPNAVSDLADYCSNPLTPQNIGGNRFTQCCMTVTVDRPSPPRSISKVIVRRDLMVAIQCRASQYALNSGTGRFHTVPTGPFDNTQARQTASVRSAGGIETNFMPDLSERSLGMVRNTYFDAGFSDVCVPAGRSSNLDGAQCTQYAEHDLTTDPNVKDAGIVDPSSVCSGIGDSDSIDLSGTNFYAQTLAGQYRSLRRAAAPWNACIMPGSYASAPNKSVKISPCEIIKHFNMLPQVYSNSSMGWTEPTMKTARWTTSRGLRSGGTRQSRTCRRPPDG